nr:tegument protein UL24 [Mastomys natalensis cytomegalovirus 3]WEG69855.1 tegument protein UL24 [Mastomys natalensis cytomegalovirus 3]WEG69995.1 tegument protein UL24 [Mastomys natalensis cytomegalovirus 3]WEG70135.1 tegument protein UL24 [Mastomys natalensis cytomegalovirus 3]WEG70275.1 tegument protein UL24 [Mastomys natalensis cytomegalovirus 3]
MRLCDIVSHFDAACRITRDEDDEIMVVDVLREISDAASRGTLEVENKIAGLTGTVIKLAWPAGATITVISGIRGWEPSRVVGCSRILRYCCCELFIYPVGRARGLRSLEEALILVDIFGRFHAYREPPDDAVYFLAESAEEFAALGFRYLYPIHCAAGPIEVGMVLSRLWIMLRHGATVGAVSRFVIRAHGETVVVGRQMPGSRELLRVCSLGCLRWGRRGSAPPIRELPRCPAGEKAVAPLGRVKRGFDRDFGVPVFIGIPTGAVYALAHDGSAFFLIAGSVPGFAGLGMSRYEHNRRFGRRALRDCGLCSDKAPTCLAEH